MSDPVGPLQARFSDLRLREEGPHGQVYGGRDETGASVTVAVLGPGPAGDPHVRNAFADAVWRHSVGSAPQGAVVCAADLHAPQPWAAIRDAGSHRGAGLLLAGLSDPAETAPPSRDTPAWGKSAGDASGWVPPPTSAPPASPAGPAYPGLADAGAAYAGPAGTTPPYALAGPEPAARGGAVWWLLVAAAALVAAGLLVVGTAVVLRISGGGVEAAPPTPEQSQPIGPSSPGPGGTGSPGARPALRQALPVSVIGPTYERTEETYTMAFPGWPFAFRTPLPWNCVRGEWDRVPEALWWSCVGEPGDEQLVNVILWECPTECTFQEQLDMMDRWLDAPDLAERAGGMPDTYYVESDRDGRGKYSVDLAHFSPGPDGGPLRWLVGVYVESPPETREAVLKIMNDIVTQAG